MYNALVPLAIVWKIDPEQRIPWDWFKHNSLKRGIPNGFPVINQARSRGRNAREICFSPSAVGFQEDKDTGDAIA